MLHLSNGYTETSHCMHATKVPRFYAINLALCAYSISAMFLCNRSG